MHHSYQGRVAIVTGGARGIGEATCRLLVERGARVVIADLLEEEGRALAADLGEHAVFRKTDVSVRPDWDEVVRTATDFGTLAILVNNAGILVQATVPARPGPRKPYRRWNVPRQLLIALGLGP